ncbi:MAG: MbtH family protein [Gemmatimonadetes bacterium]|nr:MbtH family protein [Gemmatimonadota bacterium]
MSDTASEDVRQYGVVVNDEEQYSIWLAERELPLGWKAVGRSGTKNECLQHIGEVWTDMRPLSLRRTMAETAAAS